MNFLRTLDKGIEWIVNTLVTIAMAFILFVVFFQVTARFFHFSIGGFEEFPVYMMLVGTWLTASIHVKKNNHISLNLFEVFIKNEKAISMINIITNALSIIAFGIFTVLAFKNTIYNFEMKYSTAALKLPYWILIGLVTFSTALMTIYYAKGVIRDFREVKSWK